MAGYSRMAVNQTVTRILSSPGMAAQRMASGREKVLAENGEFDAVLALELDGVPGS